MRLCLSGGELAAMVVTMRSCDSSWCVGGCESSQIHSKACSTIRTTLGRRCTQVPRACSVLSGDHALSRVAIQHALATCSGDGFARKT